MDAIKRSRWTVLLLGLGIGASGASYDCRATFDVPSGAQQTEWPNFIAYGRQGVMLPDILHGGSMSRIRITDHPLRLCNAPNLGQGFRNG